MYNERMSDAQPIAQSNTPQPPAPHPGHESVVEIPARWHPATKRMVIVVLLIGGALIFWISRPVLPLLVIAGMVSYLLNPIVDTCERLRIPRSLSTLVLYLFLLVTIILTPILVVPVLIRQLTELLIDVPEVTRSFLRFLQESVTSLPTAVEILGFQFDIAGPVTQLQSTVSGQAAVSIFPSAAQILDYINRLLVTTTNVVGNTAVIGFNVVGGLFSVLLSLLFLFFLSLYMTKDAPRIRRYVEELFPLSYQSEATLLMQELGRIWQSFFRGQIILSLTIGVVTYVVLTFLDMPGALILAIVAGALEVVPNIGPVLAMLPALIVALVQGSDTLAISNFNFGLLTIGVYFVIQQLENQLLVPRIVGTSVNLHPIVVLCGVVVGASLGGILGALLAAPTIASLRVIVSYLYAKLLDQQPSFPLVEAAQRRSRTSFYRRVIRPRPAPKEESAENAAGDRGLEIGDRGSDFLPSPQSPVASPQSPIPSR
ncbi:MAG: AI-2E family transporter [Chloroflexi bacterium]|nr:MAG: AI-2E family transporter [Chloroflexota bacterium]